MDLAVDSPVAATQCVRAFEQEFGYVYRTLRRLGVPPTDAEDLTQEVFFVMWRRRDDWDARRPLRPWLAGIAFRVASAHRRRYRREIPDGAIDQSVSPAEIDQKLGAASARETVLRALEELPLKQRALMVMVELDGVPIKEVAATMGVPLFTAYSRLRTARTAFARHVRRMQLISDGERGSRLRALTPAALLGFEREAPPPALELQRRVGARLRGRLARGEIGTPAPVTSWRLLGLALGGAVAIVTVGLGVRLATTRGQALAATVAIERPPASSEADRLRARRIEPARAPALLRLPPETDAVSAAHLADGLVAYWRFDDASGAVARDLSGNGNDCTIRNVDPSSVWIDGVHGSAARIGRGGWLECLPSASLDGISNELTISAWVQHKKRERNLRTILSRQRGDGRQDEYYLGFQDGDMIFSSEAWHRVEHPLPPLYDRWIHLAAVRDHGGMLRLYVDGVEIAHRMGRRPHGPIALHPDRHDKPLLMGAAVNGPSNAVTDQRLNGALDEVIVYHRALGPAEIAALAAGAQPRLSL